ncbi:MAG: acyl-CoA/acyl-ACP dehydrogenase [Myxococcota bacterium]|nr:acyl-CoA/acyl-ACP dehydrogenase [Myxococcota bacterium]
MSNRSGPIGLSDEQAALLESAAKYCKDQSPIDVVRGLIEDEQGFSAEVFQEMAEFGWLGIAIPEADGGAGLDMAEVVPVVEQMGRRLMAGPFVASTLVAQAIVVAGTQSQKQKVLPALADGAPGTLLLSEPHCHFDPLQIRCQAVRNQDGLILSGTKCLGLDVPVAHWALVSAIYEGEPALVLLDQAALQSASLRREVVIDETRRSFRVDLDGVRVPSDALLETGRVRDALARLELTGALLAAAEMCGAGQSCIDYTVDYLNQRKQFGRPIGSYQALKHTTVHAHIQIEQARSHLYAAAHVFGGGVEAEIAVRMAKAAAGPALAFAADRAIQFHGGYGFTYECDAQLYRRRAIWGEAQFGDAMYQRRRLADLIL